MIDKEVITKKFQDLNRYLKELEDFKSISWGEFSSSLTKQWMVFHGLQLSIQVLVDAGNHILAAMGENRIEDYNEKPLTGSRARPRARQKLWVRDDPEYLF